MFHEQLSIGEKRSTGSFFAGFAVTALLSSLAVGTAAAQSALLTVSTARPQPGSIVNLSVRDDAANGDSISSIAGTMGGEPLHFQAVTQGTWRAFGGVPVDASDKVIARAVVTRSSGAIDSLTAEVVLPRTVAAGSGRRRQLAVSPRFTNPMDAETEARVARENARAREVGRNSHDRPQLWTLPFLRPRASTMTSRFGSGRLFNGTVTSRHLGVDFRGAVGAPVSAANRGVIALVDDFFLAGSVVYIDHGGGLVTSYFHLSKTIVAAGDTVERGEQIGSVGASGRVTGPHLHWSARYGALTVNPMDLLALRRP